MGFVDAKLRFNTIMPAAYGYLIFPLDYNTFMNSVSLFMNKKNMTLLFTALPAGWLLR
jgi:hypothetical protein